MSIRQAVEGEAGYYDRLSLSDEELATFRDFIRRQYLDVIARTAPDALEDFAGAPMRDYHLHAHRIDHAATWTMEERMLPPENVRVIREMAFFRALEDEYGPLGMTDLDMPGRGVYWRIVRPGNSDVGMVHADKWYWDLGHGSMPEGFERLKIWIAIETEPGLNGLAMLPGSHLRDDWRYHPEFRAGYVKPHIDEDVDSLDLQLLPLPPGGMAVFHDAILHAGVENRGRHTRISAEFTALYRP